MFLFVVASSISIAFVTGDIGCNFGNTRRKSVAVAAIVIEIVLQRVSIMLPFL